MLGTHSEVNLGAGQLQLLIVFDLTTLDMEAQSGRKSLSPSKVLIFSIFCSRTDSSPNEAKRYKNIFLTSKVVIGYILYMYLPHCTVLTYNYLSTCDDLQFL